MPCVHKNTLWCCVTEPCRPGQPSWSTTQHVRYLVARLRSAYSRHIGDPDWEEDIRRLASLSREFADLWARHEVADAEPRTLTYLHPRAGTLSLAVSELDVPDMPEARIVVYTPRDDGHPGQDAADPPDRDPRAGRRVSTRRTIRPVLRQARPRLLYRCGANGCSIGSRGTGREAW